jgi:hypothetical protein
MTEDTKYVIGCVLDCGVTTTMYGDSMYEVYGDDWMCQSCKTSQKETKMKECSVTNCNNTSLVYSGIDAFMLGGIPTEKYCYACAGAYAAIKVEMEALLASS